MLPLRDINPTRRFPIATVILIAINVLVYFVFNPISIICFVKPVFVNLFFLYSSLLFLPCVA